MSEALAAIRGELESIGFRKRAGQVFTMDLGDEVLGWLGLNRASRRHPPGVTELNPVVGIRHQGIERMIAELRNEAFHKYLPPTVSSSLGYLTPEHRYRSWVVDAATGQEVATDLVVAVERFAVPFMTAAVALPEICRLLEEGLGFEHQLVYRRPVAWRLVGDEARASALVDRALADLGDHADPAAAEFRRFAAAFRGRKATDQT